MSNVFLIIVSAHYDESRLPLRFSLLSWFRCRAIDSAWLFSHQFSLSSGARVPERRCLAADLGVLDGPPMGATSCQPQSSRGGGPPAVVPQAPRASSARGRGRSGPHFTTTCTRMWTVGREWILEWHGPGMDDFCWSWPPPSAEAPWSFTELVASSLKTMARWTGAYITSCSTERSSALQLSLKCASWYQMLLWLPNQATKWWWSNRARRFVHMTNWCWF